MTPTAASPALTEADQDAALREALIAFLDERYWRKSEPPADTAVALIAGPISTLRARATAAEDKLRDREAEIERLRGELKQRDHLLALRTRQNTQASQAWARAAASALGGDLRALHDRWQLHQISASTDARIVQSASTDHPASSEEATDVSGS